MAEDAPVAPAPTVTVWLPGLFQGLFPTAPRELSLHADTVAELIGALDREWPGMRDRICDTRPAIRRHMNVFVEGRRANLATRLAPGSSVFILTAISGG